MPASVMAARATYSASQCATSEAANETGEMRNSNGSKRQPTKTAILSVYNVSRLVRSALKYSEGRCSFGALRKKRRLLKTFSQISSGECAPRNAQAIPMIAIDICSRAKQASMA
jgi:hypothetical protein